VRKFDPAVTVLAVRNVRVSLPRGLTMSFVATAMGSTSGLMTNVNRLLPPNGVERGSYEDHSRKPFRGARVLEISTIHSTCKLFSPLTTADVLSEF
jgi:hypothetical protein